MNRLPITIGLAVVLAGCASPSTPAPRAEIRDLPGHRPDGSILLPNQWSLRPAGKQTVVGDFPINIAIHPSGRYAAVLHSGYSQHEVVILALPGGQVVSRASLKECFYGIQFSPDGKTLYCSGAGTEVVHLFEFEDGYLSRAEKIAVQEVAKTGITGGLAVSADNRRLYVANVWGHSVSELDLPGRRQVAEVRLGTNAPVAAPSLPAPTSFDEASITKRAEAILYHTDSSDPFPYTCVLDEKRNYLLVSLWAQSAVAVVDLETRAVVAKWPTQDHPNEMLLTKSGDRLYVANANRNTVTIIDPATGRTIETLVAELRPGSPPGSTPNSLALTPDGKTLFVANANINTVAVFDVSEPGKSRSLGFIPVGWYPTSVRVTPDGKHLLVANGKGIISKANPHGPQPGNDPPATIREYIGSLFPGTVSIINLPDREAFEKQLAEYTPRAYLGQPRPQPETLPAGHPIPLKPGDPSPIKYCLYVIKENRTYDQVFGDMPEGNGDPSLCLFPERVTPNHHKLAREFTLLDNFYVESEVSADGHEWTMGAYATDFTEKMWPLSYGHNTHKKYPYPSEGNFPIATPAGGYLWDRAREAGVSYRSYGEFVANGTTANDPGRSRVPALKDHFDPWFRGFDTDYPDVKRAERFIAELRRFERQGEMPRLQILRLPNDHTAGSTPGKLTPVAQVADNDLALGRLVEAVSRSKFWPQTAIFVVEDDAQNGPDHVDAHRTVALAISPYTRRRHVDSTMYSTASMLRTMELILGLRPMSEFDAAAMPMFNTFQPIADTSAYTAAPARVALDAVNLKTAWGAERSKKMNFAREDAADDLQLNEIIWRNVRGAERPMPAPVRAAFVFAHPKVDDDD
ncbi:MAG TPA: beta-propeller fold lactonase family protein [Verrucomicrobiae bacterium]|nr:beta-propeller fold lactonase family protein [Verrucomicrobiae bacterium]